MSVDRKPGDLTERSGAAPHSQDGAGLSFPQAISASLQRLRVSNGGKSVCGYFDGRDSQEVAESTLSRWVSDPSRFPAIFLPVLVELDPEFRQFVFADLTARMVTPAEVVKHMSTRAADEYQQARAKAIQLKLAFEGRGA